MDAVSYKLVEDYMLSCMGDSAHDREHVYRVLHTALLLAKEERNVNTDVLICACLLHDIGRQEQFADSRLCHAKVGGEKAYRFLREQGFPEDFSAHVRSCIVTHRFRREAQPESIEAKLLFDADKLDVTGAMGIARTLLYAGTVNAPIYTRGADGSVSDGQEDSAPSFFREYHFKLEKLYERFYTPQGKAMAQRRKRAAEDFYHSLLGEIRETADVDRSLCLGRNEKRYDIRRN